MGALILLLPFPPIAFSAWSFLCSMLFLFRDEATSLKPKISAYLFLLFLLLPFLSHLSFPWFSCVQHLYFLQNSVFLFCFSPSNVWWFFVNHLCVRDGLEYCLKTLLLWRKRLSLRRLHWRELKRGSNSLSGDLQGQCYVCLLPRTDQYLPRGFPNFRSGEHRPGFCFRVSCWVLTTQNENNSLLLLQMACLTPLHYPASYLSHKVSGSYQKRHLHRSPEVRARLGFWLQNMAGGS